MSRLKEAIMSMDRISSLCIAAAIALMGYIVWSDSRGDCNPGGQDTAATVRPPDVLIEYSPATGAITINNYGGGSVAYADGSGWEMIVPPSMVRVFTYVSRDTVTTKSWHVEDVK